MKKLSSEIADWRKEKDFYTPAFLYTVRERDAMLGKLMLVVTEVSEAVEAVRQVDLEGFKEELADTFIRLLDICGTMNIDIEAEIRKKMKINEERPKRHGTFTSL